MKKVLYILNDCMALRNYFSRKKLSGMNHLLSGISMKDELTGLYNRLGYHNLAYPLFQELRRNKCSLAILFMDMDRLKMINDRYGHAVGDKAIQSVSRAIVHNIPEKAIPVRYGGDEFLVLVPAADDQDAQKILCAVSSSLQHEAEFLGVPNLFGVSGGYIISDLQADKTLDQYV